MKFPLFVKQQRYLMYWKLPSAADALDSLITLIYAPTIIN
jgi:hypothetical protein